LQLSLGESLKLFFVLGAFLLISSPAMAQSAQPLVKLDNSGCPAGNASTLGASVPDSLGASIGRVNDSPDIILLASVHADQVRFAKQPEIRVRLCWGGDSLRVVERTNLPSPVVAGTTYRDVFINLEILGHVNASCLASKITGTPVDSSAKGSCAGLSASVKK
jgi:hypothetical protein